MYYKKTTVSRVSDIADTGCYVLLTSISSQHYSQPSPLLAAVTITRSCHQCSRTTLHKTQGTLRANSAVLSTVEFRHATCFLYVDLRSVHTAGLHTYRHILPTIHTDTQTATHQSYYWWITPLSVCIMLPHNHDKMIWRHISK